MKKANESRMAPGRRISYLVTVVIAASMALGFLMLCLLPKQEFSESENRYLAAFPEFSAESLINGKYMSELQDYLNDHFPARDFFMGLKTSYEKLCGKMEINGIYAADDGYYIEEYQEPKQTGKIISAFSRFTEKIEHAQVTLMLVPTAVTVYEDKLPKYAVNADQMEALRDIYDGVPCDTVELYDAMAQKKNDYQLFYRYDHHWTSYGAYIAYEEYCKKLGFSYTPLEEMKTEIVSDDFKGTVYSKVNDYTVEGDSITIMPQPEQKLSVRYDSPDAEPVDSLYNEEYLDKKDQYSYFLDNIHPYIEITNDTAATDRELVVIKDSYANCMVPFLVNQYHKVYVYDTRYYRGSVSQEINENPSVSDVLILYNMNTIDHDTGIGGIR